MALTDDFLLAADEMFNEFGFNVIKTAITLGAFDVNTGFHSKTTTTKNILGLLSQKKKGNFLEDSYAINDSDIKLLLYSPDSEVKMTDELTISGIVYNIMAIEETKSELTTIYYTCMIREKKQ